MGAVSVCQDKHVLSFSPHIYRKHNLRCDPHLEFSIRLYFSGLHLSTTRVFLEVWDNCVPSRELRDIADNNKVLWTHRRYLLLDRWHSEPLHLVLCEEQLVASVSNASEADDATLLVRCFGIGEIDVGSQRDDQLLQLSHNQLQSFEVYIVR